jgi:hypothetical protein
MGRRPLNRTKDELNKMNSIRVNRHRALNREKINARRMELYYAKVGPEKVCD